MAATPKKSASVVSQKVQAIRPTANAVNLPDGWLLQSPFGFMRYDATPSGLLVRLADVLHWLEKSRSLPRVIAIEEICTAMTPDVMQWLYFAQPTDYAKPVPADCGFGYQSAAQIEAEKIRDRSAFLQGEYENGYREWHSRPAYQEGAHYPDPVEPGLTALLKALRHWWQQSKFRVNSTCDILDDPQEKNLVNLAIRLDKAAALWGYGQLLRAVDSEPSTFAELVALRKAKPRSPWTTSERQIVRTEVDKRISQPGHRKDIAAAFNLTASRIGELINPNNQPKRHPAANLRSIKG